MLIHANFDTTLLSADKLNAIEGFVENITFSHRNGYHRIIVERDIIAWIINNIQISVQQKIILQRMGSEYSTWAGIKDTISNYIEIFDIESPISKSLNRYRMGLLEFNRSKLFEQSKIIVENIVNDKDIIDVFLTVSARTMGVGHYSAEYIHGGGADLPSVVRDKLNSGYVVATIFDSDKRFPGDVDSEKQRKCRSIQAQYPCPVFIFIQMPCREIENLIPNIVISDASSGITVAADILDALDEIDTKEGADGVHIQDRFKLFFDYKIGYTESSVSDQRKNKEHSYIKGRFGKIGWDIDTRPVPGLGSGLVSRISIGRLHAEIRKCPFWNEVHFAHFRRLVEYLAGGERRYTF